MKNDFIVVKIGNSQEFVKKGDEILVHSIQGEVKKEIELDQVLLTNINGKIEIGTPFIKNVKVKAVILEQVKGPKVRKEVYKAKSRQRRHVGHRQPLTKIKIVNIN